MSIRKGNLPVGEDKFSGYRYGGAEIILCKQPGKPIVRSNPKWYPQSKKVEACTLYAVYGSIEEVEKLAKVPAKVLREWSKEPWWAEILKEVYVEQNDKLGSQITDVLTESLLHLKDRLENGDSYFDKNGNIVKKPVDARVLSGLFNSLAVQRRLVRGEPTSIVERQTVDDKLDRLAQEFKKFAASKTVEGIVEVEDAEQS